MGEVTAGLQYVERPATLCIPLLLVTFSVGNGARIYRPDFFTVPTAFWLNLYWLLLCGTLIYLLVYGIRATLVLRTDPRSRTIANFYLASSVFGILACVGTAYVLVANGAMLGLAAGLFAAVGQQPKFWGLVLPHGLLELTSVFVAGGAGLRLGWTLIDPGDRPRAPALAEEGRRAVVIVLGLGATFRVAGTIEGFVTGRPWPTWLRVGIGVVAEAAFLTYVVVLGRRAAARGRTGALGEEDAGGWLT